MNKLLSIFFYLVIPMSFLSVEAIPTHQMTPSDLKAYVYPLRMKVFPTTEGANEFDKLLDVCRKNRWTSCRGIVTRCYTELGVKRCPAETVSLENFEDFIIPLAKSHGSGDVVMIYPPGISMDLYKKSEITVKRLLNKFPRVKEIFNTVKDRNYRAKFKVYIQLQKTEKVRIRLLKEFAEAILKKSKNTL